MSEETPITRAEAARRLGVTRPMITKYIARGLPTLADGKIPWPAAKDWHAKYVCAQRSGNYRARAARTEAANALKASPEGNESASREELSTAFAAGVITVWGTLRATLPGVLGDAPGLTAAQARDRIVVFAVMNHLIGKWFEDVPEASLKPIPWKQFRRLPDAENIFAGVSDWLRATPKEKHAA